jgi:KipI family sensor histidine kinase inhibitor
MIGFLPGFPYLGGLDERIAVRRLDEPRIRITAGSIGIGGSQTGIYPLDSPGGWRLIARTPVRIYDPASKDPVLFRPTDIVRFKPVAEAEYLELEQAAARGEQVYTITEGGTSWVSGS